jgi:hypothetical protein
MSEYTEKQLDTLRHMLGINNPNVANPEPTRDYYCANPNDAELVELEAIGAVRKYAERDGYWWYTTTDKGRAAAIRSHRTYRKPKAKRVYSAYLRVSAAVTDLTFREFLAHSDYEDIRRNA